MNDPDADQDAVEWVFRVYGASKAESERAGWAFMKENHPSFVFNAGSFSRFPSPLSFSPENPC
jgi:hypothetical protein